MKYIRTKEGKIIDLEKRYQEYLNNPNRKQKTKNRLNFYKQCHHNAIKKVDTIEELCDEFVAIGYGLKGKPAVVVGNNGFRTIKEMLSNYEIYGAIWTDKGLIYIAKMNEKGELELLCQ